ncbi:MAG: hypothetical protein IT406_03310 [Candidatus Yanofskybacteria bacterium]|nr:hypothetical protein [Candidatus Yanofskybacteria bacterium]
MLPGRREPSPEEVARARKEILAIVEEPHGPLVAMGIFYAARGRDPSLTFTGLQTALFDLIHMGHVHLNEDLYVECGPPVVRRGPR